jgi:hypothetical protein
MTTRISEETIQRIGAAWPQILGDIAAGALVRDALKAASVSYAHVRAFIQSDATLRAQWDDAREQSAEAFIDEALEVARGAGRVALDDKGAVIYGRDGKPLIIRPDSAHARTMVDTLKWAARIRNPRAYSDKMQVDHTHKHLDLTKIIADADARLNGRIIEHEQAHAALAAPKTLASFM